MFYKRLKIAAFKPTKYHYALLEYLAEELRSNNVKCRKKVSRIDIKMDNPVEDKYDNIIIDCFNGKVYLRGKDVSDKKVMSLRRFGGYRESDAMYSAKGACKQILKYLEKINKNITVEAKSSLNDIKNEMIDYRNKLTASKKNNIKDLRNKVRVANKSLHNNCKTKLIDFRNKKLCTLIDKRSITAKQMGRNFSIVIIDQNIYEADTCENAISKYLYDLGIDGLKFSNKNELRQKLGYNFYSQFATAEYIDDKILLDDSTFENITIEQVIQMLKDKYKNINIINKNILLNKKGCANMSIKRLKKD